MFSSKPHPQLISWNTATKRMALGALGLFLALVMSIAGTIYLSLYLSLGDNNTEDFVSGLNESVLVETDQFGIPTITATSRTDGFAALGYMSARDRLFQMDLLRRRGAGRLAEIFGEAMVPADREQRVLGFEKVANEITQRLPAAHRAALEAYAAGVNSAIDSMNAVPFEFLVLGYRPERWRIEDSLLIVLSLFQDQSNSESEERMLSVMEQALPRAVYEFLTPMTDFYTQAVLQEEEFSTDGYSVPVESLTVLLNEQIDNTEKHTHFVRPHRMLAASNAWAVAGAKTKDGRAILANDMHTTISVPNLWYRCHLKMGEIEIAGVSLPGTPLMIAGTSRHIAWGMTALVADVMDLVKIELNPKNPNEYLTADGWKPFGIRHEVIQVKGGATHELDVKTTIWGPIALKPLLNQLVAMRWTALDPLTINLGLLEIYTAETLAEGMAIINDTGGPPLNAIFADKLGGIGWTTMGRLPVRRGFDGSTSRLWSDGSVDWVGYISPQQLPRMIDSPNHFIANANNRGVTSDYPFKIGHAFTNGYRAYRIAESLQAMDLIDEEKMLRLQLDTHVGIYGFYRDVALSVLGPEVLKQEPRFKELRSHLMNWDGKAEIDSLGLAVLVEFRIELARVLFEPFLLSCREWDDEFEYSWVHLDIPLQALLREKDLQLLSGQERKKNYANWDAFLMATLEQAVRTLSERHGAKSLHELTWGRVNTAHYAHPLSRGIPGISLLLNLPKDSLAGCDFCVRVDSESFGASERLVISPAHWEDGILQIPGGQSGHPLSDHYRDQHPYWVNGRPINLITNQKMRQLKLLPARKNSAIHD